MCYMCNIIKHKKDVYYSNILLNYAYIMIVHAYLYVTYQTVFNHVNLKQIL